jgi:hypothetical protein
VFQAPSKLNPRVSPQVDEVILRGLQESPKARFATIEEFKLALDRALSGCLAHARQAMPRRLAWTGLALTVLAAAGGACAWLVLGGSPGGSDRKVQAPAVPAGSVGVQPPRDPHAATPHAASTSADSASSLLQQLKEFRAREIWKARGSPTGPVGEALRDQIWAEASDGVQKELEDLAYAIWKERGAPTGPEGEAAREGNWLAAEKRLYKRWTGKDPPDAKTK